MSGRITPRIEVLDPLAERLEPDALPAVLETAPPASGLGPVLWGATTLILGLAALGTGNFVADQFARGPILGWLSATVAVAGFGLIATGIWRELRGLFALTTVDHLRARLADPAQTHKAALAWLDTLPEHSDLREAIRASNDPDAVLALLRAGPVAVLRAQAEALGRDAAIQVFAATAAIPSPALDGLVVAWRGARLVRQIAALHGMRPGLLGTISLLRRTLLSAATVAATDLAADATARALLSSRLLQHIAGDVATAGVAARRMIVLSRVTAAACSPVE